MIALSTACTGLDWTTIALLSTEFVPLGPEEAMETRYKSRSGHVRGNYNVDHIVIICVRLLVSPPIQARGLKRRGRMNSDALTSAIEVQQPVCCEKPVFCFALVVNIRD